MNNSQRQYLNFGLLFLWIAIGAILRFYRLDFLPPWTDESATIVFSLGNSFYKVPVNELITIDNLLEPLIPNPTAGVNEVIHYLSTESTHPPVYFLLTHWWLKLFPLDNGIVSVWAARSLSAILGILSIPTIFFVARKIFPSPLEAHLAAGMMAVSPLGIFLAQQARHYTLVILLVIISLYCFLQAFKSIQNKEYLSVKISLIWVTINALGMATHYFFIFSLSAQFLVIVYLGWRQYKEDKNSLFYPHWRRIYGVIIGSMIGCLVWLPAIQNVQGSEPTDWIYESNPTDKWLEPIGRFIIWLLSMFILLPSSTYDLPIGVILLSGIVTLLLLILFIPNLIAGIKLQRQNEENSLGIQGLLWYCVTAIVLFFTATYFLGMDLTLAPRFYFIFFPAVILLLGIALAGIWQGEIQNRLKLTSKTLVMLIWAIGLLGGVISVFNLGYLQSHRPDIFISTLEKYSSNPAVIATPFKHHGHTGRMTSIAWGLRDIPDWENTKFFLENIDSNENYKGTAHSLKSTIDTLEKPLDLWMVNFRSTEKIIPENCKREHLSKKSAGQYNYKLYLCQN